MKRLFNSAMSYLKFNSKSKSGKCLSNFADLEVQMNGNVFLTGEHAFHFWKYSHAAYGVPLTGSLDASKNRQRELITYATRFVGTEPVVGSTGLDAKRAGGKKGMKLEPYELYEWNTFVAEKVQREICEYKFKTYPECRDTLAAASAAGATLVHQDNRATKHTPWGGKISKEGELVGQNKLGKIWEEYKTI